MKSIIYLFDPVIYPFKLLITKKWDSAELGKRFWIVNEKEENVEAQDDFNPTPVTTARVLSVVDKESSTMYYMILLHRPKDIRNGIITHETIHLVNAYLQYIGFSAPKPYDDEQYAYFGGWVANCIWSVRANHPDIMKGIKYE